MFLQNNSRLLYLFTKLFEVAGINRRTKNILALINKEHCVHMSPFKNYDRAKVLIRVTSFTNVHVNIVSIQNIISHHGMAVSLNLFMSDYIATVST